MSCLPLVSRSTEEWGQGSLLSTDGLLTVACRSLSRHWSFVSCHVYAYNVLWNIFPVQGILWPVFHHVVDVYGDQVMRFFTQDTMADLWQCYANVNRRFRDKIVEVCVLCLLCVSCPFSFVCSFFGEGVLCS